MGDGEPAALQCNVSLLTRSSSRRVSHQLRCTSKSVDRLQVQDEQSGRMETKKSSLGGEQQDLEHDANEQDVTLRL